MRHGILAARAHNATARTAHAHNATARRTRSHHHIADRRVVEEEHALERAVSLESDLGASSSQRERRKERGGWEGERFLHHGPKKSECSDRVCRETA